MTIAATPSAALNAGLEKFLAESFREPVAVSGLKRLTGGTSHETWAFDLRVFGEHKQELPLVLRRDFGSQTLNLDLKTEFALVKALFQRGIPVPEPLFCVSENSPIATPFIISARLDGKDVRKAMAANPDIAKNLGQRITAIQAAIHGLDWRQLVALSQLPVMPSPLGHQVHYWSAVVVDNLITPEPLLALAIEWLSNNIDECAQLALVHGDFKANNLLFASNNEVAVIDWELAHVGDPYEDLAFTLLWTTDHDLVGGMLSKDQYLACYTQASGEKIDDNRLFFWQVFALVKLAGIFLKGFAENNQGESQKPTRIMLVRAMPWINQQLAMLLARIGWS